ncbi:carboxypeptidase regulatory-like domain-containing protein [Prescottella subtropica]|uniref:carboxypeptidase regulatory-like domain-containing protein n=1 Tax=Prescottella subtropica TaxID=2545757 RepID=UPI0010FA068A|nr:carboxypeptidase regulatory-like domain-containing protein [Prescottella subtropica]
MRRRLLSAVTLFVGLILGTYGIQGVAQAAPDPVIAGTMTNTCAADGNPAGAWVIVRNTATNADVASMTTDATGAFQFQNVPPGNYTVRLYPPAGCGSVPNDVVADTTSGNPVTGLHLEMVKVFSIYGFVTGCPSGTGDPTQNVTVNLRNAADAVIATTATNPNGWYFFQYKTALPGYVVEVVPPQGCTGDPLTRTVDLSSGDANDVDFALTPQSSGSLASLGSLDPFGSLTHTGSLVHSGSLGSSGSQGS